MEKINFKYKGDKEIESLIGFCKGNFYITKRKPQHYMRKYGGYGVSETILIDMKSKGVTNVLIIYEGKLGKKYFVGELDKFLNSKKTHKNKEDDLQMFLSEQEMKEYKSLQDIDTNGT